MMTDAEVKQYREYRAHEIQEGREPLSRPGWREMRQRQCLVWNEWKCTFVVEDDAFIQRERAASHILGMFAICFTIMTVGLLFVLPLGVPCLAA